MHAKAAELGAKWSMNVKVRIGFILTIQYAIYNPFLVYFLKFCVTIYPINNFESVHFLFLFHFAIYVMNRIILLTAYMQCDIIAMINPIEMRKS